jgi:hypothetical protein
MVVSHYVYLLLEMPRKTGILTFCGDLKRSYDYDQETIEYASTTHVPDASTEVLAAAQQLPQFEMVILTKKSSQSSVKPTNDIGVKGHPPVGGRSVQNSPNRHMARRQIGRHAH